MIKFRKNFLKLALFISSLSLNAYATNLNDLPEDIIKGHILPKCELRNISNYSNLSQVSQKFHKFVIDIFGTAAPGIRYQSELKDIIEIIFKGERISINPSKNLEFNQFFNFTEATSIGEYRYPAYNELNKPIICTELPIIKINLVIPSSEVSLYPDLDQCTIKGTQSKYFTDKEAEFLNITTPSSKLHQFGFTDPNSKRDPRGEVRIFFYTRQSVKTINNFWPFQSVTKVLYKKYFPLPLEEDHKALSKLVNTYSRQNPNVPRSSQYASQVLPKFFHFVDYIVFGFISDNEYITAVYRFGVQKNHSQELIDGLNSRSLPRRQG